MTFVRHGLALTRVVLARGGEPRTAEDEGSENAATMHDSDASLIGP